MDHAAPRDPSKEIERLTRRLERERSARIEAEAIAERGLRELYEKQQQLQLLEAIAVASNEARSIRDALQLAVTKICQFIGWPIGHSYLVQSANGQLRSAAIWHGVDSPEAREFLRVTESINFDVSTGLPGRVLESGVPVWIEEVTEDSNFPRGDAARKAGIKAAFAFPVLVGSDIVAVMEFFSSRALPRDPTLLRLMAQIGTQLGRVVERTRAEEKLIHDASHDPLTGLPNRALFMDRLRRAIARHKRHPNATFAVLFIDLDRFKVVNDSLGHLAGDELITQVAARLNASLREEDVVARLADKPIEHAVDGYDALARLGGDEFTVLLEDINELSDAVSVADRIQNALTQPFLIHGQEIYASASIGIVSSATGYSSADEVLRDADLAMYRAKALGKRCYQVYDQTLHTMAVTKLALETSLRRALLNNEFVLHYQPIVVLDTGEVVGVEALVRWRRSETELVYPAEFIEIAEDTGLILFLGMWILREACRALRKWQEEFPRENPITVSVNVSARQFVQPDFVQQVRQVIAETGVNPKGLRLEVAESVTSGNGERTMHVLSQLRELGVRFSIDDFGTGYSSLSYLHRFPLDVLKIDRSFISKIQDGAEGFEIVHTILTLARNLGIEVVAEGTETAVQVEHLKKLGCDFGQGYFFSQPLSVDGVDKLLSGALDRGVPKAAKSK